jgi:hypothetical protein
MDPKNKQPSNVVTKAQSNIAGAAASSEGPGQDATPVRKKRKYTKRAVPEIYDPHPERQTPKRRRVPTQRMCEVDQRVLKPGYSSGEDSMLVDKSRVTTLDTLQEIADAFDIKMSDYKNMPGHLTRSDETKAKALLIPENRRTKLFHAMVRFLGEFTFKVAEKLSSPIKNELLLMHSRATFQRIADSGVQVPAHKSISTTEGINLAEEEAFALLYP